MKIEIYTDGSCKGNGTENAVGGYAFAVLKDKELVYKEARYELSTTNQRMEMRAVIAGMDWLAHNMMVTGFDEVYIYTDSAYIYNCVAQHWYESWRLNDWMTSRKTPVANRDLWEEMLPIIYNPTVTFKKVRGHSGHQWNDFVDYLAQEAAEEQACWL